MTVDQLCQLPLAEQVARDAVLFLCVPGPLLVIGAHLPLIKAWGFRPTAMGFVLIKLRPLAGPAPASLAAAPAGMALTGDEHPHPGVPETLFARPNFG